MDCVTFEYIFIDDGSQDGTLPILRDLSKTDNIKYLSFSRNFGKEAAIFAGLSSATGDFVALMDADMQDPPNLLPKMHEILATGDFDCVATRRITRKGEPPIRSFFAKRFYSLINTISDTQLADGARDFRLMSRQMVDAVLSLGEYNRFSKGLFSWVGFRTKYIDYENVPRVAGNTKWSFWRLFAYSLDGIVGFSVKPLVLSSLLGILLCFIAFASAVFIVVRWLLYGDPVQGWATIMTTILFVGGLNLLCIGILGQYLAKTYTESKRRPIYIVREKSF